METVIHAAILYKAGLDIFSAALLITGNALFFRPSITDRLRAEWRHFRTRFMPTGPQDNACLAKLYREGKI